MNFFLAIFNKKQYLCCRNPLKLLDHCKFFTPSNMLPTVALIYDFDGTLAPGNMQEFGLLQAIGYANPNDFWDLCDRIAKTNDAGGIAVVMYAIQAEAQRTGIRCTRDMLRQFGKTVQFFPGVIEWFKKINAYAAQIGIVVKHYINSSGIKEMVEGCAIAHEFEQIYACTYLYMIAMVMHAGHLWLWIIPKRRSSFLRSTKVYAR